MKISYLLAAVVTVATVAVAAVNAQEIIDPVPQTGQIVSAMDGKTKQERYEIKSRVMAKAAKKGAFTDPKTGITVNIVKINKIGSGVEIFARGFKDGIQLGFGSDGDTDVERFRFFNPPILVEDPNGPIVYTWVEGATGNQKVRKLREDPVAALKLILADTMRITGRTDREIIPGKVGNTTDTFYSDTGGDGFIEGANSNYTTSHDAVSGTVSSSAVDFQFGQQKHSNGNYYIWRGFFPFDTSAITDTDIVSSATFSVYGTNKLDITGLAPVATVVSNAQTLNTVLATTDYNDLGTTGYATVSYASYSTSAYNDFSLDANGLAQLSLTGFSKFGLRTDKDIGSSQPGGNLTSQFYAYAADQTGTTNDPKLVIVHAAAGGSTPVNKKKPVIIIMNDIFKSLIPTAFAS